MNHIEALAALPSRMADGLMTEADADARLVS